MSHPIMQARADRARKAMAGGDYESVKDLLTDLMHLCDEDKEEYFPESMQDAQLQFRSETGDGDDIEQDARRHFDETGRLEARPITYEIRMIGPGDSTTSGPLDLPESEVLRLFEIDSKGLDSGERIELSNYDTDEILKTVTGPTV